MCSAATWIWIDTSPALLSTEPCCHGSGYQRQRGKVCPTSVSRKHLRLPATYVTSFAPGLYPAASLMAFQQAMFNFGNEPYRSVAFFSLMVLACLDSALSSRYLDPAFKVQSLNGIGELTEDQRVAIPRLMTLQQLQRSVYCQHRDRDILAWKSIAELGVACA